MTRDNIVPEIDPSLCSCCGMCVEVCPTGAVDMGSGGPTVARPADCSYCALCDAICPQGAITCVYEIVWQPSDEVTQSGGATASGPIAGIRGHHAEILRRLRDVRQAVAGIRSDSAVDPCQALENVAGFLEHDLGRHTEGEDRYLYPAVDDLLKRCERATATMSLDHEAITEMVVTLKAQVRKLAKLQECKADGQQVQEAVADVVAVSHYLEAIVSLHLRKEERILLPLAERYLPEAEAQRLWERMHSGSE